MTFRFLTALKINLSETAFVFWVVVGSAALDRATFPGARGGTMEGERRITRCFELGLF